MPPWPPLRGQDHAEGAHLLLTPFPTHLLPRVALSLSLTRAPPSRRYCRARRRPSGASRVDRSGRGASPRRLPPPGVRNRAGVPRPRRFRPRHHQPRPPPPGTIPATPASSRRRRSLHLVPGEAACFLASSAPFFSLPAVDRRRSPPVPRRDSAPGLSPGLTDLEAGWLGLLPGLCPGLGWLKAGHKAGVFGLSPSLGPGLADLEAGPTVLLFFLFLWKFKKELNKCVPKNLK